MAASRIHISFSILRRSADQIVTFSILGSYTFEKMAPKRVPATEDHERLLVEAAKLDPRHFGELYEENFDRVYAFAIARVRDRAEAQDVTAEVFHHALDQLGQFEWRGTPFVAWLYRIAANEIADRAKRAAKERTLDAPEIPTEDNFDEAEERAEVFRQVRDLPPDQQRVVVMRFVEEKSIREIAAALGRSEGAVKQLQFRALQNLRARLDARNRLGAKDRLSEKNG
jgi:RNA polymerase sigma-70 factor, ECF subfamily